MSINLPGSCDAVDPENSDTTCMHMIGHMNHTHHSGVDFDYRRPYGYWAKIVYWEEPYNGTHDVNWWVRDDIKRRGEELEARSKRWKSERNTD